MYIIQHKKGPYFFADTTVNIDPTAEEMVDIIGLTARTVRFFDTEPRIAVHELLQLRLQRRGAARQGPQAPPSWPKSATPSLLIDGEMQANVALSPAAAPGALRLLARWPSRAPTP